MKKELMFGGTPERRKRKQGRGGREDMVGRREENMRERVAIK